MLSCECLHCLDIPVEPEVKKFINLFFLNKLKISSVTNSLFTGTVSLENIDDKVFNISCCVVSSTPVKMFEIPSFSKTFKTFLYFLESSVLMKSQLIVSISCLSKISEYFLESSIAKQDG